MDISQWPMNRIMGLPDHCFGRRWTIGLGDAGDGIETVYRIAEGAVPDILVLWELSMIIPAAFTSLVEIEVRLGDQLPADAAEFDAMELLLPCVENSTGLRSAYTIIGTTDRAIRGLKMPVKAQGRRFVVAFHSVLAAAWAAEIDFVVSSIPREIPDWFRSV